MKINNMIITYWFNKIENPKSKFEILSVELNEYFSGLNLVGVPSNYDPIMPRITAASNGGHSKISMSQINFQTVIDFDENFNLKFDECFDYAEKRIKKIFKSITENCEIEILYSAILVNLEKEFNDPIKQITSKMLNDEVGKTNHCEVGIRLASEIDEKFYKIVNINNSKLISFQQTIEANQQIIFPLISLFGAKIEKNVILVNYEMNDKLSFDNKDKYKTEPATIDLIFDTVKTDVKGKMGTFIEEGIFI